MLDFPNSPSIGQTFPSPPVTGVPIFTWDGVKWIAAGAAATVVASDTPPVGVPADTLWWESDTGLLYVLYNDGNSTQWVIACPQPDISTFVNKAGDTMTGPLVLAADPAAALGAATKQYVDTRVRYDAAQGLSSTQQTQARSNVYAAPFDALAYNGMQLNGSMDVSQESGTAAQTASGRYIVDGFESSNGASMAVSMALVADAPPGLSNSIKITVTTAAPSLAATDLTMIQQPIEGARTARLAFGTANAQPVSIGFWSKAHRVGTYSGSLRNGATNRSCVFSFTQNVADTWQYNTVTLPGDTAGTWVGFSSAVAFYLTFAMAVGTTYSTATLNTWLAGNFFGVAGAVNGVAATTDTFQITGVVFLPGIELPSAARAPFIMRPYDQELTLCKRHLNYFYSGGRIGYSLSYDCMPVFWPAMRAIPTTTVLAVTYNNNCFGLALDSTTPSGGRLLVQISGQGSFDYNQVNIKLDARL